MTLCGSQRLRENAWRDLATSCGENDSANQKHPFRVIIFLLTLAFISLTTSGCSKLPWEDLSPRYDKGIFPRNFKFRSAVPRLESIWTGDGRRLWTVGESGTILRSDDGKQWKPLASGTEQFLRSITGSNNGSRLWVVGDNGTLLESEDGEHWKSRDSGTQNDLRSIYSTTDGKHLWAVGAQGTIRESEDGEHWIPQASGTQNDLQAILGNSDGKRVWAVGAEGTILQLDSEGRWKSTYSGPREHLVSIFQTQDSSHLWILAANGRVLESDDGEHWTVSDTASTQHLTSLFGVGNGSGLWAVGNNGQIMKSEDGTHWNSLASPTQCNLRSLVGTRDGNLLWAVGEQSTILQSEDGQHWHPLTTAIQNDLTWIVGTSDGRRLWAVGNRGTILQLKSNESWKSFAGVTDNDLLAAFAVNGTTPVWVVGRRGTTLQSDDGDHWTIFPSNIQADLFSVFASRDGRHVWATGSNGTIVDSEEGRPWRKSESGTHVDLSAMFGTANGEQLWAVGGNGTIVESKDGQHWKSDVSGSEAYLSSVFSTGDGKRVWAAGANGTILESDNGGQWSARITGTTEDLIAIFGTSDGMRLWAVGRRGAILQSDDGSHWNLRSRFELQDLLSVFETSDGSRVWAVGKHGTILQGSANQYFPVVRRARIVRNLSGQFLELQLDAKAQSPPTTKIWLDGRNDYDDKLDFRWRRLSQCVVDDHDSNLWQCGFEPVALNLEVGQRAHLLIHVLSDRDTNIYEFTTLYDPWQWIKLNRVKLSFAGAFLLCIALPTILLFVRPLWNLKIYRAVGLSRLDQIKIPMIGDFVEIVAKLVTVLPWFVRHPRTLDAWVEKNREEVRKVWHPEVGLAKFSLGRETTGNFQTGYFPLPVREGDYFSGNLIERPSVGEMGKLMTPSRTTIQIIGPGGAGKTSLARQLSEWAIQSGFDSGGSKHCMLPIWIDEELDTEKKTLPVIAKGRLVAALPNETIEDELFNALLKRQRLLVVIDRVSERSSATQRYIETIYRSGSIGCLVLTSRNEIAIDGAQSKYIYPQPLNSATLLNFMTGLLAVFLHSNQNMENSGRISGLGIEEQLELGKRLAALIRLHTEGGNEEVPLVPLVVRLFVEQAARLIQTGQALDNLPLSLPEVYFRHLRQVNPEDTSVPHYLDGDRMLRISKVLAKMAIGENFVPKEFSRQQAIAALVGVGEAVTNSSDPLIRLKLNGILLEKAGGLVTKFRFSLDPIAEFLAAAAYADECVNDGGKWETLLQTSSAAPGFHVALKLMRQAYAAPSLSTDLAGWTHNVQNGGL
jgi:photosystem II stability/assembly factor-like uncharacterized protein